MAIEATESGSQPLKRSASDAKSFWQMISQQEEKTRIFIMQQLLNENNLEFITEYPNFTYTKAMTRMATWTKSIKQVTDLDDEDISDVVDTMCMEFMKKNVSHKRRRAQEIVNALKGEESGSINGEMERSGLRKFLGLR